jgi:molybdopterin-containing oxidoreductase family iron-sulfur binding subunit
MSTEDKTDTDEPRHPYETDESFHPMGAEWEDRMREELEDTDYDADLGMQMARDAQRLVAGEISEEQFYAEYHDDVKEEFEADERPIFDDLDGVDLDELEDESLLESLADVDLSSDDVSRRDLMSKMGAAGLFLGYSAFATYDNQQEEEIPEQVSGVRPLGEDEREHRWGMVIDLDRCDGCLACVTGCIDENGTSTGANWMYVFNYEDEQSGEDNFLVRPCQHCSNAPCAKVCPVRARHTREKDGLVLTNYETCIGCRYCQVACPYGVNYFQWGEPDVEMDRIDHLDMIPEEVRKLDPGEEAADYGAGTYAEPGSERHDALLNAGEMGDHVYDARGWWVDSRPPNGVMGKCTMCPSRQDETTAEDMEKGTVACMDACDNQGMSAIHFGDMDAEVGDDYDRAVRYLERRTEVNPSPDQKNNADPEEDGYGWPEDGATPQPRDSIYEQEDWERPPAPHPESQISSFKLLEDLGTRPNITYIGNEPGPEAEQYKEDEAPVAYSDLENKWGVEVKDKRIEHLDYGASGPPEEETEG